MLDNSRILYEDSEILVYSKEAGLAVESKKVTEADLISLLRAHCGDVYMVHRLDQVAEGILVFAKTAGAAGHLSAQVRDGTMKKYYTAAVSVPVKYEEGELTDLLVRDGRSNTSKVTKNPKERGAKKARLKYRKIGEYEVYVELLTGRHHQIRVQLANAGMPIVGDGKYGGISWQEYQKEGTDSGTQTRRRKGIALCACDLRFIHPDGERPMHFRIAPSWRSDATEIEKMTQE